MREPVGDEPTGIQRIALTPDARKIDRSLPVAMSRQHTAVRSARLMPARHRPLASSDAGCAGVNQVVVNGTSRRSKSLKSIGSKL
jgi:hypothetical protein